MAMTELEARQLAEEWLNRAEMGASVPLTIVRGESRSFGWVFWYQSLAHLRSGNPIDMLAGNGPLIVLPDGSLHTLPSHAPNDFSAFE